MDKITEQVLKLLTCIQESCRNGQTTDGSNDHSIAFVEELVEFLCFVPIFHAFYLDYLSPTKPSFISFVARSICSKKGGVGERL